jgi:hypothetical protein
MALAPGQTPEYDIVDLRSGSYGVVGAADAIVRKRFTTSGAKRRSSPM